MILSRSIHISTNDTVSFPFMAEYYAFVYMYHTFFIHSSVDGPTWLSHTVRPCVTHTLLCPLRLLSIRRTVRV